MKKITVIGGTGKLGAPTVKRLVENGIQVKAVVRALDAAKANKVLPPEVELVEGDLENVESLKVALKETEYLYLNLSTVDPRANFIPEIQGVENILKAAADNLKQIIQISGLGALHPEFHPSNKWVIDNEIRVKGHKLIREADIPHTVFHCTWFVNTIPWFIQGDSLMVFGTYKTPMYWTNTNDLGDAITASIGNEAAFNKDLAMQGEEGVYLVDAAQKFVELKKLPLQVINVPIPEKELGPMGDMLRYFQDFEERFCAEETHRILGKPKLSFLEAINTVF